jgi:hypothetical protein
MFEFEKVHQRRSELHHVLLEYDKMTKCIVNPCGQPGRTFENQDGYESVFYQLLGRKARGGHGLLQVSLGPAMQ